MYLGVLIDTFMKTVTAATPAYESPRCWVFEFDSQELVCTSNESYEEGDTSNWFDNNGE